VDQIRLNDLSVLLIEFKGAVNRYLNYLVSDFENSKVRRRNF